MSDLQGAADAAPPPAAAPAPSAPPAAPDASLLGAATAETTLSSTDQSLLASAQSDQTDQLNQAPPDTAPPTGAPESYADFTLPDGMSLDASAMDSFTPLARELNLTQEQAQKLVSLYADRIRGVQQSHQENWSRLQADWLQQSKNDPEIGRANLPQSLSMAAKAMDQFGGKDFRQTLDSLGLGNHPVMVKFLANVGRALSEDSLFSGGKPKADPLAALYPTMKG